jgi:hypothetical protein
MRTNTAKASPPSEKVAISEAILQHAQQQAKARQREHGKTAPGRMKNTSENFG